MANTNDFEVRVATLIAMGGDATNLHTIFEVDKEILRLTEEGGGGGGGLSWDTVKDKLSSDGVDEIKFNGTGETYYVLSHLGSNNGAFLNTGYQMTENTRVQFSGVNYSSTGACFIGDDLSVSEENNIRFFSVDNGIWYYYWDSNGEWHGVVNGFNHGSEINIELGCRYAKDLTTGEYITEVGSPTEVMGDHILCFLPQYNGSYENGYASAIKIYEGETLVKDFVPVKNSAGVYGFYDTVAGEFKASASSAEYNIIGTETGDVIGGGEQSATLDYDKVKETVTSKNVESIWVGTQEQYDALATKSDNVLYVIK